MEEMKKCPMCAEEIKADAESCPFCSAEFDVSRRGYCSNCHKVVEAGDSDKCPECGAALEDVSLHSEVKEKDKAAAPAPPAPAKATPVPSTPGAVQAPPAAPQAAAPPAAPSPSAPVPGFAPAPSPVAQAPMVQGISTRVVGVRGYQYALYLLTLLPAFVLFIAFLLTIAKSETMYMRGGIGFTLIGVIVAVIGAVMERPPKFSGAMVQKRQAIMTFKAGMKAQGYDRGWRKGGGLVAKILAFNLLYAAAIALNILNISTINENNMSIKPPYYILLGACILGFVASLSLWSLMGGKEFLVGPNAEVTPVSPSTPATPGE